MALYVVGAGGLGRETYDGVLATGADADAFVDEELAGQRRRGLPVVGLDRVAAGDRFVIGIADPSPRRRLAAILTERGAVAVTVVHPQAVVGPDTELGDGCVILANAHVSSSVRLGAHVHINYNATVGHDTVLEGCVTLLPGASVAGNVHLEDDVTVGTNASVLQGLRIGRASTIGAGAVVTRSCDAGQVLLGVPARPRTPSQGPGRRAWGPGSQD
ncbi:MAG: acetyltransferase [Nitriliruptorales bacterium]|nr:acetyltransferase [Nitriliruptorales bacterium]